MVAFLVYYYLKSDPQDQEKDQGQDQKKEKGKGILERLALNWNIVTIVILGSGGQSIFKRVKRDSLEFSETINEAEYKISKNGLYEESKMFYTQLIFDLLKVRFWWILFNEGSTDPMGPIETIISPKELWLVSNSGILRKALLEALGRGVNTRLLIIILGLALAVIYYLLTGGNIAL